MNKVITNIAFVIISLIVFVILGNLFFLSNLNFEIATQKSDLKRKQEELSNLQKNLNSVATDSQKINDNIILNIGQEGQLMSLFINEGLQKYFNVNTYDLYSTYSYKPENLINEQEFGNSNGNYSNVNNSNMNTEGGKSDSQDKIPELDENGMPKDSNADSDNGDDWEGLTVLPLKLTFSADQKHLITIIDFFQQFPVNTIRVADLIYNEDKVSGTFVFAFPINENEN